MERRIKRYLLTVLMAFVMTLIVNPVSYAGQKNESDNKELRQEPQIYLSEEFVKIASKAETQAVIYEIEGLSKQSQPALAATSEVFSEDQYDEIVDFVRDGFKNRETTIILKYTVKEWDPNLTLAKNAIDDAMKHTGVGNEGDYIERSFSGYSMGASGSSSDGYYIITVTIDINYYTTKEQEDELAREIDRVLGSLNLEGKTDYEKFRLIYDYICENITYDNANLNNGNYMLKYTAYAALINKTAVCQGYSCLLYRMLLESGVDNRVITGLGNGGGHAWNIVKPDAYWYYYADSTWDATYKQAGRAYKYCLRCLDNFSDHEAAKKADGSYEQIIIEILNTYPIAGSDYTACDHDWAAGDIVKKATQTQDGEMISYCNKCIERKTTIIRQIGSVELSQDSYIYDGTEKKPSVTVKDADGNLIDDNNYIVSYVNNISGENAQAVVEFSGMYEGTITLEFTIIVENDKPEIEVVAGNASIDVTWDAVPGATKYRIFTYQNGKYTKKGETTNTSFTIKGLNNGVEYGVYVLAYIGGNWVSSDVEHIVYATPSIPGYPLIELEGKDRSITVRWNAVGGATKYRIFTYVNKKYTKIGETFNTEYTVDKLTNGKEYGIYVIAYVNGKWLASSTAYIRYAVPRSPLCPVITGLTAGNTRIAASWEPVEGAESYRVFTFKDNKYTKVGTTTETSFTVKKLTNGQEYGIYVIAYINGKWISSGKTYIRYATPKA